MAGTERTLAVLGAGKAGEALISGVLSSGWCEPGQIVATARHAERLQELADRHGIRTTAANAEAVDGAGIVVIGVKPQDIESLLGDIAGAVTAEQTVVSIAAAIPTALIEKHLSDRVPVVRAMPNTPMTVHEGMAGISAGTYAEEEHLALAEEVLGSVGRTVRVDEDYMDAIHGRVRLGPGVLRAARRVDDRGRDPARPLRRDLHGLVVQTMLGTAKLLRDEKMHPVELRDAVTSLAGRRSPPFASWSRPVSALRSSTPSRRRCSARKSWRRAKRTKTSAAQPWTSAAGTSSGSTPRRESCPRLTSTGGPVVEPERGRAPAEPIPRRRSTAITLRRSCCRRACPRPSAAPRAGRS